MTVTFPRLEACVSCNGRGVAKGGKMTTCRTCRGSGQETRHRGPIIFATNCRACRGTGQVNPDPCPACSGTGSVRRVASVQIDIPAGVADGETFSVRREGSSMGGERGDLIITVAVAKSDVFSRKKNDIYVTVPINLYQAIKGDTVIVPTISGPVEMKIPAGTQPDDVKRLNGRGIYNAATREQGNQFVKIKVDIPRNLTSEQLDLLARCFDPSAMSAEKPAADRNPQDDGKHSSEDSGSGFRQWFEKLGRWLR